MRIRLLYPDRDSIISKSYQDSGILAKDLNLQLIFEQCGRSNDASENIPLKDDYIRDIMKKVMLCPLEDKESILYRQGVLKEAVKNPKFMEELYVVATEGEQLVTEYYASADKQKNVNIATMEKTKFLRKLMGVLDCVKELLETYKPEGLLGDAFKELKTEYNEDFINVTNQVLDDLEFATSGGKMVLSTGSLQGLKAKVFYIDEIEVLAFKERKKPKSETFAKMKAVANSIINPEVKELKEETLIADARNLEDAACEYIMSYYDDFIKNTASCLKNLRPATAFLLGTVRLYHKMQRFMVPVCFPDFCENLEFEDLCETCLCIYNRKKPVGNNIKVDNKKIILVTGANQGGKSTYLRSIGLALVMFHAGMFVTADKFSSRLYDNIFVHFTRREDSTMNSGRLDEELRRMSQIVDRLTSNSIILLNESFATTTEKEGSQIAMDLTKALLDTQVRMISVTHLLEYVNEAYEIINDRIVFLSAGRRPDGTRSYKINECKPENTSYGLDLYNAVIK